MKIWKFPVNDTKAIQKIEMPNHAEIRHLGIQNNKVFLWAEVQENNPVVERTFFIVGTGHPIPTQAKRYIGTFQAPPFVWHLYSESL